MHPCEGRVGGSGPCCRVPGHSLGAWAEYVLSALGSFCPRGCHLQVVIVCSPPGTRLDPFARSSSRAGPRLPLGDAALSSSLACSALGILVPWVPAWLPPGYDTVFRPPC